MASATLDLGNLRTLSNRVYAFIDGQMSQEIGVATLNEIVPNIIFQVAQAVGVPVAVASPDLRMTAGVIISGSGVSAEPKIPLEQKENKEGEEEEGSSSPAQQYGVFPIIRFGGHLQFITSTNPQQPGQKTIGQAVANAFDTESVESLILTPIMTAIRQAISK